MPIWFAYRHLPLLPEPPPSPLSGIGFGLGTFLGLVHIEIIALAAFLLEVLLSCLWLRFFRFGPLEWLWRMLTYGHYLPLRQQSKP